MFTLIEMQKIIKTNDDVLQKVILKAGIKQVQTQTTPSPLSDLKVLPMT